MLLSLRRLRGASLFAACAAKLLWRRVGGLDEAFDEAAGLGFCRRLAGVGAVPRLELCQHAIAPIADVDRRREAKLRCLVPARQRPNGHVVTLGDPTIGDQNGLRGFVERWTTVVTDPGDHGLDALETLEDFTDLGHSTLVSSTKADTKVACHGVPTTPQFAI
jgi:hypothetical protein